MSARESRGAGIPLTDEERVQRHFEETGEWLTAPPPRGTGLTGLGNPFELGDITTWLTANWKWVLGIGGGVALLLWFLRKK